MSHWAVTARLLGWIAWINLLAVGAAFAQSVTVGPPGAGCAFTNLQSAIDGTPGVVTFQVAGSYSGGNIAINNRVITIMGVHDCSDTSPDPTNHAWLSGDNYSGNHPVVRMTGHSEVNFYNVDIFKGHNANGNGGGIDFEGDGTLDLYNVNIHDNKSETGAGIYVDGSAPGISVTLHTLSFVNTNTASGDGGGIHIEGETHLFADENYVMIDHNVAVGSGGGMQLVGAHAIADIGSPGEDGSPGVVNRNDAFNGGGLSIEKGARARLFATVSNHPATIEYNTAQSRGGGVFIDSSTDDSRTAALCAFGYGINHNVSADGAAVYAAEDGAGVAGGSVVLTLANRDSNFCGPGTVVDQGAVGCPVGTSCNTIDDNIAQSTGAVIVVKAHGSMIAEQVELRRNHGANILRTSIVSGGGYNESLIDCLIADNNLANEVIVNDSAGGLSVDGCTIAGNTIGPPNNVFTVAGALEVLHSIVWQPTVQSIDETNSAAVVVQDSIIPDAASFPTATNVHAYDPLFVGAIAGSLDYHLTAESLATDYSIGGPQNSVHMNLDLDGNFRGIDHRAGGSAYDAGAYEVQTLLPPTFPNDETFEELDVPALPIGWVATLSGAGNGFTTTLISPDTGRMAAFTGDPNTASDSSLRTSTFSLTQWGALTFRQRYETNDSFDGAVLEISINAGPFQDMRNAGGVFLKGGYDGIAPNVQGHPLRGRGFWTGNSGGYKDVSVLLPPAANGKSVQLRWRFVSDQADGGVGYWIDNIHVDTNLPQPDVIFPDGFDFPK